MFIVYSHLHYPSMTTRVLLHIWCRNNKIEGFLYCLVLVIAQKHHGPVKCFMWVCFPLHARDNQLERKVKVSVT